ncbi:YtzI protein [Virgibacillus sp. NKC19-3]|uniref:YtzI protein n=1 Tax=Virgibacillus saliphilus TaxID=2831674 RepID=UPI001C9A5479|nr:YtzI protein [Virgibacillus sp. NKC19-3]MBY7142252.1 YtzI protein [Virgibacillus sp. NKC19-3]
MGDYLLVGIISIIAVVGVLLLSLLTLSKGYAYKHSIDPHPDEEQSEESQEERGNSG